MLDATLRLARAEDATLVPAYLARVPMHLPLDAPLPRQCNEAMPLLEAIEQRASRQRACRSTPASSAGAPTATRCASCSPTSTHDRVVVAADTAGTDGFDAADIAWLLDHARGEILVLRPADDDYRTPKPSPLEIRPMSFDSPM